EIKENGEFEILSITDRDGKVILRSTNPGRYGDSLLYDQLVKRAVSQRHLVASPVIVGINDLQKEGEEFAERARIKIIKTPGTRKIEKTEETSGLMIKAAAPIWSGNGEMLGVIYGGDLINGDNDLVDKIKNIISKAEKYNGIDMGSSTIFLHDLRIATNVMTKDGKRATGTCVSKTVYDKVLVEGELWMDRAFAVNYWYITAYEPIKDIDGSIIGILGVGLLEDKFTNMRNTTLIILFGITIVGMIVVFLAANVLSNSIINPLNYLVRVSKQISGGDFQVKVDIRRGDELGELERAYKKMAAALRERDEKLKKAMDKLEELSRTDSLTGILNRRAFDELAQIEIDRAKRYMHPISIAYIDLDNFKIINDEMGHNTGDILLLSVSNIIKSNIREIDLFARLGGDEFILLLSKTDAGPAYEVLVKLQKMLLAEMEKNSWPVTFSIGLVTFHTPPPGVKEMIKKSDEVMYSAKQAGKNRIEQTEIS
ncbi:MAG: diguanylate cyclase, partial [Spirochaetes bacterium]|nr:diguanylate cyclase [Spirochaetota bacterium]